MKADNGKHVSRIHRSGIDAIEAAKEAPDMYCELELLAEDKLVLKADTGKYLSRIHRSGIDAIEAAKNYIDPHCKFEVYVQ